MAADLSDFQCPSQKTNINYKVLVYNVAQQTRRVHHDDNLLISVSLMMSGHGCHNHDICLTHIS